MSKLLTIIILVLIVLFGSYLRLANLGSNPNGLYVDEAATGVNAWSILQIGKDEYGKDFPLAFRFFGSYTPPLYTYLTSQVMRFNGLSVYSIRLTSAISGILLIVVFFLILKSLDGFGFRITLLTATALFAIVPWAIFYSRIGYEVNLAFLLYSLGVLFLALSLRKSLNLIPGLIFLSLSTNAYHSERLLAHLTVILFLIIFKKELLIRENIKIFILGFACYLIILIPQLLIFFTPANTNRGFGLFYADAVIRQAHQINFLPMFLSAPLAFFREFFSQYFSYFSPRNLFFQGDSDLQRSIPEASVFYWWMAVFYVVGLFNLVKSIKVKTSKFIVIILMLAPIPAALTGDPFSTQRSLPLLLPLMLVMSLGLDKILKWKLIPSLGFIFILSAFSLVYLYRSLAVLLPNERAKEWGYGFSQLSDEIKKRPGEKFLIDASRIKPAYIELAFYLKIPPEELQKSVDLNLKNRYYQDTKWSDHYILDGFETRRINWEEDIYQNEYLVGDELAVSESQAKEHFLEKAFEIRNPSHEIIFQGYKTNPALKCRHEFIKDKCKI